jgi:pyridoxamine 5'-phosphate oxidase
VVPDRLEFWTRDPHRLHDRVLFERRGDAWVKSFLFP